jgi:branched-chain amino acid transport system permease protein
VLTQAAKGSGVLGDLLGTGEIGALRLAAVGLVLMLLIVYRPQGLIGNRREMSLDV